MFKFPSSPITRVQWSAASNCRGFIRNTTCFQCGGLNRKFYFSIIVVMCCSPVVCHLSSNDTKPSTK
jgi:hypothetical protein